MKDAGPAKALIVTAWVVLGTCSILALLAVLFPVFLTGRFSEIKFESIEFPRDARVRISYCIRTTVSTRLVIYSMNRSQSITYPWRIPAWPFEEQDAIDFNMAPAGEDTSQMDPAELRRRILIEAGKVYRLRPGERLVFFRWPEPAAPEGYFEIRR